MIPLQGLRVLDLSEGIAGPFCTKFLADYGAEVIKVEKPDGGDWTRGRPPFYRGEPGAENSLLFAYLNTSKRSVTLDLETEAGREAVCRLAADSDVMVLSQPLSFLERLPGGAEGLRQSNPKLVVSSVPYFEGGGPFADYKATELTLYAMSGLMSMATGDQRGRLKAGGYQAQYMAGIQTCAYTLFAALKARRQDVGSFVEASVAECCARVLAHMQSYTPGQPRDRSRPIQEGSTWECQDGSVMIMMYYYQMETLGALIGDPTLKSDTSTGGDIGMRENRRVWQDPLRAWLKTKTAEEAEAEAQREHLLFSKVNNAKEVVESEHLNARDFFVDVDHPVMGRAKYPIGSYHLTGNDRTAPRAAPALGEANDLVLHQRLGLHEAEGAPDQGDVKRAQVTGISDSSAGLPLEGVRILDLTHRFAGPTLTMLLGDWGADVIKIEWWDRMDAWRGMISVKHDKDGEQAYNKRPNWLKLNRSKRSLTLNLKEEKGQEVFLDLVRQSDVVVDNFSAGVLDRLGLGYDVLRAANPRIISLSLPGFGNYGPHSEYVSNGGTIQGYAGVASITGYEDDHKPRVSIGIWADPVCGVHGASAIGMALLARELTGEGQRIELAQAENMVSTIGESILDYTVNGVVDQPLGNADVIMAPHGSYPALGEDEWITLAVADDHQWSALCSVAGRSDWFADARFATQQQRWENRAVLDEMLSRWTATQEKWTLTARLQEEGIAAAPVVTIVDFHEREAVPARDFYQELAYPYMTSYPGPGARLDGEPIALSLPPPMLGEHNEAILRELLGYSDEDIEALRRAEVI